MSKKAFVLMPFAPDFDDVFEHIIRASLESAGFTVSRADEVRGSRSIMHDVVQGIFDAELIVADLTSANPNVYYELGIAHALRKKVILLAQDLEEVPFDLRAYRVVTYSTHFARVAEATALLLQIAVGAQDESMQFSSPVSDYCPTNPPPTILPIGLSSSETSVPDDDYGPLDVVVDVQEGMQVVALIISDVGTRLSDLNPKIVHVGEQMQGPLRQNPTQMRELVRSLAAEMDDYSRWMKIANARYRNGLNQLTSGLDALFISEMTNTPEAQEHMSQVVEVLAGVEAAAIGGRESMLGLIIVLESLPKIEKEFNRAKRRFSEETQSLVGNIDQTISVMARTRAIATRSQSGKSNS